MGAVRVVIVVFALAFIGLFLCLPAMLPASRFMDQVKTEHSLYEQHFGARTAVSALDLALAIHGESATSSNPGGVASTAAVPPSPVASALAAAPSIDSLNVMGANQIASATSRLFNNSYMDCIDAMFFLFLYRFAWMLYVVPLVGAIVLVAFLDGGLRRKIKVYEFQEFNPEYFSANSMMLAMVPLGSLLLALLPVTIHPLVLVTQPVLVAFFGYHTVASYHAR